MVVDVSAVGYGAALMDESSGNVVAMMSRRNCKSPTWAHDVAIALRRPDDEEQVTDSYTADLGLFDR